MERFLADVIPGIAGDHHILDSAPRHGELFRATAAERGLVLRHIGGVDYVYDGHTPIGGMGGMIPTVVSRSAVRMCQSKLITKQLLSAAGISTPASHLLEQNQRASGTALVEASDRPWVLKPNVGSGGQGVTCDITSGGDLRTAWDFAIDQAKPDTPLLLEEQFDGVDIRAYVVGTQVVAAAVRVPAHVVGDGTSSVQSLVDAKQAVRARHAHLARQPLVLNEAFLKTYGWRAKDTPAAGEVVALTDVANLARGGDSIDVTDSMDAELAALAVRAVRAVPGLNIAGVDILTHSLSSSEGATVIELNARPEIGVNQFPAYGQPRDVMGAVIDYMAEQSRR